MTERLKDLLDPEKEYVFPFKVALFDIGEVLLTSDASKGDEVYIERLSEIYGVSDNPQQKQQLVEVFEKTVKQMQVGGSDAATLKQQLAKALGQPREDYGIDEVIAQGKPVVYPEMVKIIHFLQAQGAQVILATKTIPLHWEVTKRALEDAGLEISLVKSCRDVRTGKASVSKIRQKGKIPVFTSYKLGVDKGGISVRQDGLGFFGVIAETIGVSPAKILVIDDVKKYCQEADKVGMQSHHFTSSDNLLKFFLTDMRSHAS